MIRLRCRRVVLPTPEGRHRIQAADLTLQDGRITEVVPWTTPPDVPVDEDLGELLLTPAFLDPHTHLALSAVRGLDVARYAGGNMVEDLFFHLERALLPEDVLAFSRMAALECLMQGTAVVWDHYYHADQVARACLETGLGAVVSPALQDLHGPGSDAFEEALALTASLALDKDLRAEGILAAVGPHATDSVSDALLERAVALSGKLDIPLHMHLAQSPEEVDRAFARHGVAPLHHLLDTGLLSEDVSFNLVHAIYVTPAELRRIPPGVTLTLCPSSQQQFAFPAPVHLWEDAGVPWTVATDCGASNDGMGVHRELRYLLGRPTRALAHGAGFKRWCEAPSPSTAAALHADRTRQKQAAASWEDPSWLLSRLWDIPGRLHPSGTMGRIEAGAWAHLALWDPAHPSLWPGTDLLRGLAYGDPIPALQQVMVAGQWRGVRGRFAGSLWDHARAEGWLHEAEDRRAAWLRRALG